MLGVLLYALVCSEVPDPATGRVPQFPSAQAVAAAKAAPVWVRREMLDCAARAGTYFRGAELAYCDRLPGDYPGDWFDDDNWIGSCNVIRGRAIGSLLPRSADPFGPDDGSDGRAFITVGGAFAPICGGALP